MLEVDYIRVYSEELVYNMNGIPIKPNPDHIKNYLNHCKYYQFAAQFVQSEAHES